MPKRGINVSANWFMFNIESKSLQMKGSVINIDIENYATHIERPVFKNGKIKLQETSQNYELTTVRKLPRQMVRKNVM
jgi:hypothetical protein